MGLFSRQAPSGTGAHDYVLTGCPLVAQDDVVVLVDAVVRLSPRTDDEHLSGYDASEERALHAVFVLALRLLALATPSEELLVGRALVVEALDQGFGFAPVGTGIRAEVTQVEVRPYDETAAVFRHEFRPVPS